MYGYDEPTQAEIRSAMNTLRDRGVAKVELNFSGGGDEGGVDGATYLDAEGNPVEVLRSSAYKHWQSGDWVVRDRDFDRDNGGSPTRPATDDEIQLAELESTLGKPIYARYYTFAGEFYVDGTLTWDVASGTHKMAGQESHEVYESFEV